MLLRITRYLKYRHDDATLGRNNFTQSAPFGFNFSFNKSQRK